ncbi:uncharacterized protein G2W53_034430 [Senna tora]|uniref:Uncharacterized protein n=1 Tax=Senna tora TaxID=362788 RepID=A0A834WDR2_9FABA|nr:uncharacterized protein G2W53_034430 [Senna tora]
MELKLGFERIGGYVDRTAIDFYSHDNWIQSCNGCFSFISSVSLEKDMEVKAAATYKEFFLAPLSWFEWRYSTVV